MKILDVCCGGKMFYFDKDNPLVIFMDIRKESFDFSGNRHMEIAPDVVADFKSIPFSDSSYDMVVFDPPHLLHIGNNAYMAKKYGNLKSNAWKDDINSAVDTIIQLCNGGDRHD